MSLLQADLPSEDEADDDYDPARDDKDEVGPAKAKQSGAKRRRGSVAYPEGSAKESASDIEAPEHIDEFDSPATFAKKSKVDQLWAQLNKGKAPQGTATALRKEPEAAVPNTATPVAAGSKHFNLAAFCRPIPKKQKVDSDSDWRRQLGMMSNPQDTLTDEDRQKRATAAAAAAAAAAQGKAVPQTVTETRRFAGKDIQYKRAATQNDQSSKSEEIKKGGLDALLGSLQQTRKVNVLDKSRMDWGDFKSSHVKVDEELEGYKKSGDKYLDKVDFLKRAELRQYEQERDQRLSQDMRSRGRL